MKIEAGKFYRTRDGRKVGPMRLVGGSRWPWEGHEANEAVWTYTDNGRQSAFAAIESKKEHIAEWSEPMDLTAITTPFGLLDDATREALKSHGGPYEIWSRNGWIDVWPEFDRTCAYRVKPQPPKPREWWIKGDEARLIHPHHDRVSYIANGWTLVLEVLD